jgi:hypothetical protein
MRRILITADKKFIITVPDDATLTFGPWSPPTDENRKMGYGREEKRGTLRVYEKGLKSKIVAVFSGVTSFRDMSIGYAEEVVKEEGATIWKDDEKGYYRESKVKSVKEWTPELPEGEADADSTS